jgi:hypothetical protein
MRWATGGAVNEQMTFSCDLAVGRNCRVVFSCGRPDDLVGRAIISLLKTYVEKFQRPYPCQDFQGVVSRFGLGKGYLCARVSTFIHHYTLGAGI